ncbi:MAG: alpha/beta fold hydrolase [Gammaproteobacteria bacterium]
MTTNSPALDFSTEGSADAPTLVFLHGWPDDASLWRRQVDAVRGEYRCVLPTLPNFGNSVHEPGGCDFPEIVRRLHRLIESLGDGPVTLVIHDWGAYIGYLYEKQHPERVASIVAMDIGGHFQPATLRDAAMFVSYQWALATFWLVGGVAPPLGTWLTRRLAHLLEVPERQASAVLSRSNYPYFYFWRANLLPWLRSRLLGDYRPRCRVLFVYGAKKPLMFHSRRWLGIVEDCGGRSVAIEDGGHWFMEEQPEATNRLLLEWLHAASD